MARKSGPSRRSQNSFAAQTRGGWMAPSRGAMTQYVCTSWISMILASGIVFPFERGAPPTPTPPHQGEGNLFVGDVEPIPVGIGHLKFARRALLQEIAAHIGFLAAAERHRREIGIGARDFGDMFLEGVEVLDV